MVKRIKFPLIMENGAEVRSVEQLKSHFSLTKILEHQKSGKLAVWLRDRYAEDLAEAIDQLEGIEEDLPEKICEIFGISYDDTMKSEYEYSVKKSKKMSRLRQYTEDNTYLDEIDRIAFDQAELDQLLTSDIKKIYLCGEKFYIPISKTGITYTGINNPTVVFQGELEPNSEEEEILAENLSCDEDLPALVKIKYTSYFSMGKYVESTYLDSFLTPEEKNAARKRYDSSKKVLSSIQGMAKVEASDMNLYKFKRWLDKIYLPIRRTEPKLNIKNKNTALALIYDYDQCNEFAKAIMDNTNLCFQPRTSPSYFFAFPNWGDIYPSHHEFKDPKAKLTAANQFINAKQDRIRGEKYKFYFWALLLLSTDQFKLEEYFSLICNFSILESVSDEEFENILQMVKSLYDETEETRPFQQSIQLTFESLFPTLKEIRSDGKEMMKE